MLLLHVEHAQWDRASMNFSQDIYMCMNIYSYTQRSKLNIAPTAEYYKRFVVLAVANVAALH
jgi:hypothetical protein